MKRSFCVIGAGTSGLGVAKHFSRLPGYDVIVYERENYVGGMWKYNEDVLDENGEPKQSPMYKNLMTNAPRELMSYLEYPFTKGNHSYVGHGTALQYLEDVCGHFNLTPLIHFNTDVVEVRPVLDDENNLENMKPYTKWRVTVRDRVSGETNVTEFDFVAICIGHYTFQNIPAISGADTFQGRTIHSMSYREPTPFKSRRVVCIGSSSSGTEIALDLQKGGVGEIYLSSRESTRKWILSSKEEKFEPLLNPTEFGPPNIEVIKEVVRFDESQIHTADGYTYTVDDVIYCTGYKYKYPFLHPDCQVETEDFRCPTMWQLFIHPRFPSMCIVGLLKLVPFGMMSELQSRFFQRVIEGQIEFPTKEELKLEHANWLEKARERGMDEKNFSMLAKDCWPYFDKMAEIGHFESYKPVFPAIALEYIRLMKEHGQNYKDYKFNVTSESTFTVEYTGTTSSTG